MNTDKAIKTFLEADLAVNALIGDRMRTTAAGRKTTRPYLIYNETPGATEAPSYLTGRSAWKNQNYSFKCVAEKGDKDTAIQVKSAIEAAFEGLKAQGNTVIDSSVNVACGNVIFLDELDVGAFRQDGSETVDYAYEISISFSFISTT